jgi:tetratricopeptide (TPR) repeat protein
VATAILLVLLVVAAFSACLGNDFVTWDDDKNFLENTSYRGLGWSQIAWDWTSFQVGVYQPLSWMILGVEYLVWGLQPWGYHFTSLILYAIDTVVLFVLTLSLLERCHQGAERAGPWGSALAAGLAVALFAVHPLRTEVVAWASCQPYLPCALFEMLVVLAYLRAFPEAKSPRRGWLVGAFFLFMAALLSKAVAVTLPVLLVILDVYPLRRLGGGPGRWFGPAVRRVWWEKVPFAGLTAIFMGLAVFGRAKEEHFASVQHMGFTSRFVQACYGTWFYLIKTILPLDLTAYYPLPERMDAFDPPYLLSILGTVALTVAVFYLRRRWPGMLAVWLSYLVILAPNLGIVRICEQIAADRYSYIALFGGVVLLAAVLCRIGQSLRRSQPAGATFAAASLGVLLALILLSRSQCQTWRTTEALWTNVLTHGGSRTARPHFSLGFCLLQNERFDEAKAQFYEALRLNPYHALTHQDLGAVLFKQGHLEEARAQFVEAIRLKPNLASAHGGLGTVLISQGRFAEATPHLVEALRLDPKDASAHCNLGMVLLRDGRLAESEAQFARAIQFNPTNTEAYLNLGVSLYRQGRLDEARAQYAEALRLQPNHAGAHNNLGAALFGQGRLDEARAQYAEALRLDPNHAGAHENLEMVQRAQQGEKATPPLARDK